MRTCRTLTQVSTGIMMILSLLALAVIFLLPTVAKAQTQVIVCKDGNGNVIPCWWLWSGSASSGASGTVASAGSGGGGGGGGNPNGYGTYETEESFHEDFDDLIDPSKLRIEPVERDAPLKISGFDFTPNSKIYLNLYRDYPAINAIEPIYQNQIDVDANGNFTLDLHQIPMETTGGEFLVAACKLEECSTDSILANLSSPTAIVGQRFELPNFYNFAQETVVTDAQTLIEAALVPADELVTPDEISAQLYKDNQYTWITQDFSQACHAEWKSACEAGLNLWLPHVQYDEQKQAVEVFARGAYLKQKNPVLGQYLTASPFDPATWKIQSVVNGVPEDATTVEVTAP